MAGRWKMEKTALGDLAKLTGTGTQDLGKLVKDLVLAAEPLKGKMEGDGLKAFQNLKDNVDSIADALNGKLGTIAQAQQAMAKTFEGGMGEIANTANQAQKSGDFDAARFGKS
jgi:uncharacterized protein YukE